jgi:hypothetical protein
MPHLSLEALEDKAVFGPRLVQRRMEGHWNECAWSPGSMALTIVLVALRAPHDVLKDLLRNWN